ncbi:MAG TPA: DoxX family protein [Steroidobacteraceae bacterium]|nr:DoxX family protein [Steroidobacteraceae bacterium]
MQQDDQASPAGRGWLWTGRVLSILAILFFLFDGVAKLFKPAPVVTATVGLGFPESEIVGIGITLLICTLLYALPRTSILGAVLLTGYLGGAVAAKVRIHAPLFDIVFAIVFAAFVWGGLWLRNPRLRSILPLQP